MTQPGTETQPLRVAIIGAGPSGFYVAEHLFNQPGLAVEIDMFDRLPTPYGLVRGGVAPDHQKIKAVVATYDKIASHPGFRFLGYVEFGKDITLAALCQFYHQIVYTTGAQTDQRMGVPGEDFLGSHPATEFVAWYNGHPDFSDCQFDFSQECAAIVGVGNVAVDVARILCRTPAELARTDMADYALEALRHSRIKDVYMLGRRGPAQAAFTNPELRELSELDGADLVLSAQEAALDPLSRKALEQTQDRTTSRKVEMLQEYAKRQGAGKARRLHLRFLVSPVELLGDAQGRVHAMRLVKNELYVTDAGSLRPRPTEHYETLPAGLVFRSVGYRGVPLAEVPFDERWGVILNHKGRVLNAETRQPRPGEYTAGWIKRGPSGVIGTNKLDALETVQAMVDDIGKNAILQPVHATAAAALQYIQDTQPQHFSYEDWRHLNSIEVTRGQALGKPREKFTHIHDMLVARQQTVGQ